MGFFSIFLTIFLLFVLFCYSIAPKCIIEKKNDYVKFFLWFFSCYLLLEGIFSLLLFRALPYDKTTHEYTLLFYVLALCPALFVAHLLYPFKTVKRSQHLTFFLFFASVFCACTGVFFLLLHFSNMQTYFRCIVYFFAFKL
jgi:hypothetical protein